ncbi:unnamed protein product [Nippostrongylus brasiliensis]|uniref:Uncharacterized protein n=1 Tax=Nippostrongylus brasiliensis TaxID=27835 RepID=A0A0N4YEM2_NIPBR|nr:unnamed protein product [Nippostrongylus brasiliensis]
MGLNCWKMRRRKKRKFLKGALALIAMNRQSAYGIGLLILLIAALPRILPQLMEPHAVPVVPISVYIFGTMLNFFLLYVYWHWYWHVASLWGSAVRVRFGRVVRNANNRSRRDRPMIPKEEMLLPEALDAEALRSTAIGSKELTSMDGTGNFEEYGEVEKTRSRRLGLC